MSEDIAEKGIGDIKINPFVSFVIICLGLLCIFFSFRSLVVALKDDFFIGSINYIYGYSSLLFFMTGIHLTQLPWYVPKNKYEYIIIHPWLRKAVLNMNFPPVIIRLIAVLLAVSVAIIAISAVMAWRDYCSIDYWDEFRLYYECRCVYITSSILGFSFQIWLLIISITKLVKWIMRG